jgi:hypothetical protein
MVGLTQSLKHGDLSILRKPSDSAELGEHPMILPCCREIDWQSWSKSIKNDNSSVLKKPLDSAESGEYSIIFLRYREIN